MICRVYKRLITESCSQSRERESCLQRGLRDCNDRISDKIPIEIFVLNAMLQPLRRSRAIVPYAGEAGAANSQVSVMKHKKFPAG